MKIPAGGRGLDVRRSALYAVIVNAVQIIAVWTLAVMLYLEHRHSQAVITFIISGLVPRSAPAWSRATAAISIRSNGIRNG